MYHQHDLVTAHLDALAEEVRHDLQGRAITRDSPQTMRALIASALVLAGARLHGRTPAVIGDRVVILDPCRNEELRLAA